MARFAMLALVSAIPLAAWAQETVTLRDGTQFSGRMTSVAGDSVSFQDRDGGVRRFDMRDIDTIRFDSRGQAGNYADGDRGGYARRDTGGYPAGGQPNNGQYNNAPTNNGQYNNTPYNTAPNNNGQYNNGQANNGQYGGNPYNGNGAYLTLPGTEIAVRTNENINSQSNRDRGYTAQVDRDVIGPNGAVVIPRGSEAQLVVRRLNDNNLALDLQSVSINGQRLNVNTADVMQNGNARQGVGENKRTAEYVGGTAVLGTLLGAIAGGGKGAAIGALAGGAAGAGAQVLTRGSQINVPAETVLSFRLDSPMTLNPTR